MFLKRLNENKKEKIIKDFSSHCTSNKISITVLAMCLEINFVGDTDRLDKVTWWDGISPVSLPFCFSPWTFLSHTNISHAISYMKMIFHRWIVSISYVKWKFHMWNQFSYVNVSFRVSYAEISHVKFWTSLFHLWIRHVKYDNVRISYVKIFQFRPRFSREMTWNLSKVYYTVTRSISSPKVNLTWWPIFKTIEKSSRPVSWKRRWSCCWSLCNC